MLNFVMFSTDRRHKAPLLIRGLKFYQTNCPVHEQYQVFLDSEQVGWVELDHAKLKALYPEVTNGKEIYSSETKAGQSGHFVDDEERFIHLRKIARLIRQQL